MKIIFTSYDDIYQLFLNNIKVEDIDLPDTDPGRYNLIHNAVNLFNNRLRDNLACNDEIETVTRELNNDELLIIIHFMRLTLLKNLLTYKNSIFNVFTKEIGVKNITAQVNSLEFEINNEENIIDQIIFNSDDSTIMGD